MSKENGDSTVKIGDGVKVVNNIKPVIKPTAILEEPRGDYSSEGGG